MRNWLRSLSKAELKSNSHYREAEEFARAYKPAKGRSYRWAYEDAIAAFDRATDAVGALDRKAESMIKYVAPGTGLLGLAFAILAHTLNISIYAGVLVVVGIVALLLSMVSCLLSLWPHRQTLTPGVHHALQCVDYEDYDSEQAMGLFATGIDWATVGKIIVADLKAKYVRFGYASFIVGFVLIFGGLSWVVLATS